MTGSRGMLAAKEPLVVPMLLRLSHFRLSSYVVLVVSKQKGITLVFKTDPLQNVDINSTFDSISVIQKFIQREIEDQLRQMFREDLPSIIHRLSQQWVKAKVEAPYLPKRPPPPKPRGLFDTISTSPQPPNESHPSSHPDIENFDPTYGLRPEGLPTKSVFKGFSSLFTPNKGLADLAEEIESTEGSNFDDEEEGTSFDVVEWEDAVPGFPRTASVYNYRDRDRDTAIEYETVPAVGGGVITRPRIYHSQSAIQPHPSTHPLSKSVLGHPFSQTSGFPTPSIMSRTPSTFSSPYSADSPAGHTRLVGYHSAATIISSNSLRPTPVGSSFPGQQPPSPDSLGSESRSSSGPTCTSSTDPTDPTLYDEPPSPYSASYTPSAATATSAIYMRRPPSERRMSVASTTSTSITTAEVLSISPSSVQQDYDSVGNPKIILRPTSNNNSIHQLSTLSHSNHTLSPYTRDLSHFTVRSVPPRNLNMSSQGVASFGLSSNDRQPVKARRKRTYRIGGQNIAHLPTAKVPEDVDSASTLCRPSLIPSELDVSEMDRYFPPGGYLETRTSVSKSTSSRRFSPHRQSIIFSNGSDSNQEVWLFNNPNCGSLKY